MRYNYGIAVEKITAIMKCTCRVFVSIAILFLAELPGVHAQSEKRIALVIGNGAYESSPLKNPVNDAADIAKALHAVGFEVIHRENVDRREMRTAVREFGRKIRPCSGTR